MEKVNFLKSREALPIGVANIYNILPKPSVSNGLLMAKLKRDLKYRSHVYFEPVRLHVVYQALPYLNSYDNFMKTNLLHRASQVRRFSVTVESQGQFECVTEKNDSDKK